MSDDYKYMDAVTPFWDQLAGLAEESDPFMRGFAAIPKRMGLALAAVTCHVDVCNGGFDQYFFNSFSVMAPEAIEGFLAIGQPGVADVLARALALWGDRYPRDRAERWKTLDELPEDELDELSNEFVMLIGVEGGGCHALVKAFIEETEPQF